ncbi:MAG: galactose oxidase-like domain-containing protein [Solirubrobacteraceae bacterium]
MCARLVSTIIAGVSAAAVLAPAAHAADPAQVGRWSALQQYPVIPISAAVLPDGNIVAWDQADPGVPHGLSPNNGRAMVIDPDKGVIARSANLAPTSVFCTLITTLPDGKVALVGGGNETYNSDRTVVYDPKSKTFGAWGDISRGRWYPGGQIDKQGNIVALGGRGGSGADVVDAATGASRRLEIGFGATYYPHVLRMPDGRFTVESISQTNAPIRSILNTTGTGSLTAVGDKSLLQPRLRLTSTMVGPYTMLGIGGGTLKTTYTLDVSSGTPVARASGTMKYPRITATAVTLPDGSALAIGGNASNSETTGVPVMTPELWSPATGQWSSMEDSPRQRQYHSVSALLPDGRVWSAGTSARGVDEYNGAYFTPPSLFRQDGSGELASRPVVQDAPASVAWGQTFSVRSPQAASIRRAALIRLAANTHQYSFDQTYVPLDVSVSGDRVSMTVPGNGNTIPAGQYMLFLTDSAGVPSKAPIMRVDPTSTALPNVTTTQSSQLRKLSARKAFDGNTTNWANGEFNGSHTLGTDKEPWWQVDFGRSRALDAITIHTRTDRFQTRTRNVWVYASDEPFTSTTVAETRAQPGVTAIQLPGTQPATVKVPLNRTARYVRIQLPHAEHLNLREVVPTFGTTPPPDPDLEPDPDPDPPPVTAADLGVVQAEQTDGQVTIRITNGGNGAGTIQSVTLPGAGWAQTSGPSTPFSVPAGGEAVITLTRGTVSGDLVVTPSSGDALRLPLEPAGSPAFTASPTSLRLSARYRRAGSVGTVTIRNSGTAAGVVGPITLTPNGSFDIASSTCGTVAADLGSVTELKTVAPGATCTVTVSYRGLSLFGASTTLIASGTTVALSGSTRLL